MNDTPMPVLFVGHGSPMNAIEDTEWARRWRTLGDLLPSPVAILAISAHWFTRGSYVLDAMSPRTIHDFSGFPPALFEVEYPASGAPPLARRVRGLIGERRASLTSDWGFDHGTWSVLCRLFPAGDVPVVQLSVDAALPQAAIIELARDLQELRHEGVLIVGSGNVTHNLQAAMQQMRTGDDSALPWSAEFDADVVRVLQQRDERALAALWPSERGRLAHPTPDHWLPLLYTYGATTEADELSFPVEGFAYGLSMRACLFGPGS